MHHFANIHRKAEIAVKRRKKEFFCPNCGATLNDQDGFDPNIGAWECTECGQELFGDKVESTQKKFKGVIWYCDNCNAVLSTQPGFADYLGTWICTECGCENSLTENDVLDSSDKALDRLNRFLTKINGGLEWISEKIGENEDDIDSSDNEDKDYPDLSDLHIHFSAEDDEDEDDDDYDDGYDEYEDDFEEDEDDDTTTAFVETVQQSLDTQDDDKPGKLSVSKKMWYYIIRKKFEVKRSSAECIGMAINDAVKQFLDWGFRDVNAVAEEDLDIEDIDKDGTVVSATINGYTSFAANSLFPFNSNVVIRYCTLRRAAPPITSKRAKGKEYREIIESFTSAGFCNVEPRAIYDLTFGWLKRDGVVESIEIEGKSNYLVTTGYRLDANIVVSYHTFKRKR